MGLVAYRASLLLTEHRLLDSVSFLYNPLDTLNLVHALSNECLTTTLERGLDDAKTGKGMVRAWLRAHQGLG